ncbi:unnamed protein product [Leptosia nina]|uniref:Uncharacterized protein n=1 Tax=Leptosia nina TaxID=320188 RepID=A0AAV1JZA1_9NEOP
MLKCYKVAPKDTKADLKRCLKERSIYKVDYKDNVSYRNAAKWRRKTTQNNTMSSAVATNERRIITSAIATLIFKDQNYLENGIAFDELVKVAASQEPRNYSKKQLESIINKELSLGSLVKLPNGALALGPADHDADSSDSFKFEYHDNNTKMTSSANSSCRSSPQRSRGRPRKRPGEPTSSANSNSKQSSGVRVGERRKMAKKVFDPSDNNVPSKRKRGRPVGSLNKSTIKKRMMIAGKVDKEGTPLSESQQSLEGSGEEMEEEQPHETTTRSSGICSVCLVQKSRGSNDRLVECRDCNNKAHLSCLQSGSGILKPRPDNTWQCPHCKTCVVCCETNDAGILTVCSICSDAYHSLCHSPRIPERLKAWDQWECTNCLESRPSFVVSPPIVPNNIDCNAKTSPSIDPFLKPHEIDRAAAKIAEDVPIDTSIPDISSWSVDDVYDYFMEHLSEAAPILRDQEFDGQALSMARRADIVRGLGLPLGPALALYRIIVRLQTRKDDWRMCWG